MNQQTISLNLPDKLYQQIRRYAEDSDRPVEAVLLESLNWFFDPTALLDGDLDQITESLHAYPTAILWHIAEHRVIQTQLSRLRELGEKAEFEKLTEIEESERAMLLRLYDRYILVRSTALVVLKQRGEEIDRYLKISEA
jgi:HEAT repeat protein